MVTEVISPESDLESQRNDDDVVLSVENVSKRFARDIKRSMFYGIVDIGTELIGTRQPATQLRKGEFWALHNVSLSLRRGDALGLVGANGSGKTTLLRIISGLIKPDTGRIRVKGKLAPLLALGAGFNPILTGRENLYLNMSILGLSRGQIDRRFDDVVEFAEIGEAIEAPIRNYSSGMRARLGFSSAIHTDPDILLIDEVLSVGDVRFRGKCARRLMELKESGTSFVFVSHNSMQVLSVTNTAIYLVKGNLTASGPTHDVITQYENDLFLVDPNQSDALEKRLPEKGEKSSGVDIVGISFRDESGQVLDSLSSGQLVRFTVKVKVMEAFKKVNIRVRVSDQKGDSSPILFLGGFLDNASYDLEPGYHEITIVMPYLGLRPGLYSASVNVRSGTKYMLDTVESFRFSVVGDASMSNNAYYQPRTWELDS